MEKGKQFKEGYIRGLEDANDIVRRGGGYLDIGTKINSITDLDNYLDDYKEPASDMKEIKAE